ncbi:hypothetical protein BJ912DRAFT_924339 [Pholiota molesta]|nr:hypothetical protein BJ912DRAFT_924339 [Pholiota molesta]
MLFRALGQLLQTNWRNNLETTPLKIRIPGGREVEGNIGSFPGPLHRDDQVPKRPVLSDRPSITNQPNSDVDMMQWQAPTRSVEELKEERRELYTKRTMLDAGAKKLKGKAAREIELAMDDFTNTKHAGFKCRRIVPIVYFANDKTPTNSHLLCDPETPTGCQRCKPREDSICCDICQPDAFEKYQVLVEKAQKSTVKSHVKPFTMSDADRNFKTDLQTWRRHVASAKFNGPTVRTLGVRILMPDQILDRIIDCAHAGKIVNVEQLAKESGWGKERLIEFGEDLIKMILKHYPPTPAPDVAGEGVKRKRAPARCSACHEIRHKSSNRSCPKHIEARHPPLPSALSEEAENIPPPAPLPLPTSHYYAGLHTTPPHPPQYPHFLQAGSSNPQAGSSNLYTRYYNMHPPLFPR